MAIIRSLKKAVEATDLAINETWGKQIEDRGSQIAFSALGQLAPLDKKEQWDPDLAKRQKIKVLTQ